MLRGIRSSRSSVALTWTLDSASPPMSGRNGSAQVDDDIGASQDAGATAVQCDLDRPRTDEFRLPQEEVHAGGEEGGELALHHRADHVFLAAAKQIDIDLRISDSDDSELRRFRTPMPGAPIEAGARY